MSEESPAYQQSLQELRQELKTLKDKSDLQQKKIKLYRKENQEFKHELTRQAQLDASLLLNSKELSEANCKLEGAIHDISLKLEIELEAGAVSSQVRTSRPLAIVSIRNITITEQTQEVDLPNQGITDQDISQLSAFKNIRSLLLGENELGNQGVKAILGSLGGIVKMQLNSNKFEAVALLGIGNLRKLKVLDLRNNRLGDGCMEHLCALKSLTELSISNNQITDAGMARAGELSQLTYLDLTTNLITDEGAGRLLGLGRLTHLYLMANRISHQVVPPIFNSLQGLEVLDIRFTISDPAVKDSLRSAKPPKLQLFC